MGIGSIGAWGSLLAIAMVAANAAEPVAVDRHQSPLAGLAPFAIQYAEEAIKARGLATDTTEQILEASKNPSFYVRECALAVIAGRIGEKAIPTLRAALDDPALRVRIRAARLLRAMGDATSGLARMQKDYAALVPDDGVADPNFSGLTGEELEEATRKIRWRNVEAMDVARVLAEHGDHRGFELAAKVARDCNEIPATRGDAVLVLVEIAIDDRASLKAEKRDPLQILMAVAESGRDQMVLKRLADATVDRKLEPAVALEILRKLLASPNMGDQDHKAVEYYIRRLSGTRLGTPVAMEPNAPRQ
jgi:HEAT repeat protein